MAVFLTVLLASPRASAAVMPCDADADARSVDDDADRSLRDTVDLPSAVAAMVGPAGELACGTVGACGTPTVECDDSRARGPP